MYYFLQQVITGATVGCIYSLIAVGYTMVHAAIGQINLAHGEIYMIGAFGAFIGFVLMGLFGVTLAFLPAALVVALAIAAVTAAAYGLGLGRTIYGNRRRVPGYAPLVAAVGLSIFLKEYVRLVQEAGTLWLSPVLVDKFLFVGPSGFSVVLTYKQILIFAVTAALLALFHRVMTRTALGRAQRACAQDHRMAALLGIDVGRTAGLTFAMAAVLAAVAGYFTTLHYGVIEPYMGFLIGLKALTAAIVGGIGSLAGAVAGGFLIAFIETFWSGYFPGDYRDIVVFGVLVAALVFRPDGLIGRPVLDAAPGAGAARHSLPPE